MQKSLKSLFCFVKLTKYISLHSPLKRMNAAGQVVFVYPPDAFVHQWEGTALSLFLVIIYKKQKTKSL